MQALVAATVAYQLHLTLTGEAGAGSLVTEGNSRAYHDRRPLKVTTAR